MIKVNGHSFSIKETANGLDVTMDGQPLKGVVYARVTFEHQKVTTLELKMYTGEVEVEKQCEPEKPRLLTPFDIDDRLNGNVKAEMAAPQPQTIGYHDVEEFYKSDSEPIGKDRNGTLTFQLPEGDELLCPKCGRHAEELTYTDGENCWYLRCACMYNWRGPNNLNGKNGAE